MSVKETLEENKNQIIQDYGNGQSTVKLGKQYGCNGGTIWIFLKKNGIELRNDKSVSKEYPVEEIKALLLNGQSIYSICKVIKVHERIVTKIAKELGIDTSVRAKVRKDQLKNHEQEIVDMYEDNMSCVQIAKVFQSGESSVGRILHRNSIKMRVKDYQVNQDFFEKIDNENKAYVLGFFTADGHNDSNSFNLRIADLEVLEKIKIVMSYNGPILFQKLENVPENRKRMYNLCISKNKICDDLLKLDCPPNKTFVTKFPTEDKVPKELLRHYIRGLMDGDGSVYQTKQQGAWHISIAGTFDLLNPLCDFVENELGFRPYLYKHGNIYITRANCSFAKRLLDYIYKDSTIYLERKYELYRKMCISS